MTDTHGKPKVFSTLELPPKGVLNFTLTSDGSKGCKADIILTSDARNLDEELDIQLTKGLKYTITVPSNPDLRHGADIESVGVLEDYLGGTKKYNLGIYFGSKSEVHLTIENGFNCTFVLRVESEFTCSIRDTDKMEEKQETRNPINLKLIDLTKTPLVQSNPSNDVIVNLDHLTNLGTRAVILKGNKPKGAIFNGNSIEVLPNTSITVVTKGYLDKDNSRLTFDYLLTSDTNKDHGIQVSGGGLNLEDSTPHSYSKTTSFNKSYIQCLSLLGFDYIFLSIKNLSDETIVFGTNHKLHLEEKGVNTILTEKDIETIIN